MFLYVFSLSETYLYTYTKYHSHHTSNTFINQLVAFLEHSRTYNKLQDAMAKLARTSYCYANISGFIDCENKFSEKLNNDYHLKFA